MRVWLRQLEKDLESPIEVRRFGSGWFSGFIALVLAVSGLCLVVSLRWPGVASMPELEAVRAMPWFRGLVHLVLIAAYALSLLSLLLRPRKALGATALVVVLGATLLGGSNVQPHETRDWGIFFGVDFFVVDLVMLGLMFAPIERLFPHRKGQPLFRPEWGEDLFYYLVSSMLVQLITFLALGPSTLVMAVTGSFGAFRAAVASQPALLQFAEVLIVTDLAQYWFHRAFHRIPFLWSFHAVHHSARSMDWLAGARMHFVEVVALRGLTSLPLLTMGFSPAVMQAYVGFVFIYATVVHANVRGDFDLLGRFIVTPRFHHWHHGIDEVAVDKNFAIHFPWLDRLFGTYHFPKGEWPSGYGVPESVPRGFRAQFFYPFRRKGQA